MPHAREPPQDVELGQAAISNQQHPSSSLGPPPPLPPPSEFPETERPLSAWQRYKERYTPSRPDPWLKRKWAVFVIYGLAVWSFYVVVGRVCTPAIQQQVPGTMSRAEGAGFLAGFIVLWLMFVWSYTIMVTTGPGFAKDVVPQAPPPDTQQQGPPVGPVHTSQAPFGEAGLAGSAVGQVAGPSQQGFSIDRQRTYRGEAGADGSAPDPSELAPVAAAVGLPSASRELNQSSQDTLRGSIVEPISQKHGHQRDGSTLERPVPQVTYGPRWCKYCKINKPDRTHHCRHCATCVMQFDHHCLWLGHCVGWANHKFFVIFNFWTVLFCAYILGILVVYVGKTAIADGQVIGLLAVAGLFFMFTLIMFPTHVWLVLTGRTTLESNYSQDQHRHELDVLNHEFGYFCNGDKRRQVKKRWNEEWGGTPVDARWAFGTKKQHWQQEMGRSPLGWILPIGRPLGDGIHFPANPRFGPNGEWLKKEHWPQDVPR